MTSDEGWAAVGGRTGKQRNAKPRAVAVAEQPMGMRKFSPVAQYQPRANPNASGSGNKPRSRNASQQRSPNANGSAYGLLVDDDDWPSGLGKEDSEDQVPTTASPSAFVKSASPKKKPYISAQEAAIPEDTVEKLLAAARAMYQQNMGVKTAAKKYRVTVQGLRHFWDTNGGSEICRAPEPKAKPSSANSSPVPAAGPAQQQQPSSGGHACSWNDSEDDQWY